MNALSRTWGMWIVRGLASVLFGVLTLVRPGASIAAIVFVYGVFALAEGALLVGFGARNRGSKAPFIVRGLVSATAGVVALLYPGPTALALYMLIGAWAFVSGAVEIGIAIAAKKEGAHVGSLVAGGVLSLVTGVALLALPAIGVVALVGLIAAYAIFNGVISIFIGVGVHQLARDVQHAV